jgi:flagellar hook-associated protein 3
MGYRITNNMMTNTYLSNLHGNLGRLTDLQRQMSTGKLYDRPSQNPIDVVRDLSLTTNIFENVQYIRNMDDAITWLKNTDQGLSQITDGVQRIRELAIYAGDGALESTDVEAIALEIEQLRDELMMTANYSVEGRYLLAGLATGTVPFVKDAEGNVVYQGNLGNVQFEMQQAFVGQVSLNGRDVFPEQFTRNALRSIEVPIDFEWKGRSEIIQIQVGDKVAKVRIPEQWTDDNTNGIRDAQDQNLFRDCEELDGYNLDQIAAIIRNSTNMGDMSKLISVDVFKDQTTGTQQLLMKSHTGEAVRVTSWPETDFPTAAAEGSQTPEGSYPKQPHAAFSTLTDTAWAASQDSSITFRWGDGEIDTVAFTQTEVQDKAALLGISEIEALGTIVEEKVPGTFVQTKTDTSGNAVLAFYAENRLDTFLLDDMTGDAAALFGGETAASAEVSDFKGVIVPAAEFGGGGVTFDGVTYYTTPQAINAANLGLWAETRGTDVFIYGITSGAAQEATGDSGTVYAPESLFRAPEPDHSHINFASYMGMETSVQSMELPADNSVLAKDGSAAMHLRLEAGKNHAGLEIPAGETLTLEQFAQRLRGVAGSWLDVVVITDEAESNAYDLLNRGMDNAEPATQKLILRTKDGTPLSVFDKNISTATFGANLGLSTALYGDASTMAIPSAAALDGNIPARIAVSVGDESFEVLVSREDVNSGIGTVLASIQSQIGKDRIGYTVDGTDFALYAKNGETLKIHDMPFCDPLYSDYSAGLAMQWGIQTGIRSDAVSNNTPAAADGTIRIETPGRSVDISVFRDETLKDLAMRIQSNVPWLNVAYLDMDPPDDPSDPPTGLGNAMLSLTAKDGSAVNLFDITGTEASGTFGMDTAIRSTGDISGWTAAAGQLLTFEVNGMEHTIDLEQMAGDGPEELVCLINSRFQGLDVKAQLVDAGAGDQRLVLTSERGYHIDVTATPVGLLGLTVPTTPNRGSTVTNSPYGQNVTVRTHSEESPMDFFGLLDNLAASVRAEDREGISHSILGDIDDYVDNLLKCRAQTGALIKRYDTSQERLTQNNTATEELRSKVADTDLAEAITRFTMAQSVYQASLSVIAKIVQPTLVDFLR